MNKLFFSGERFANRGRYDIAVFLMYRTIEMTLSAGLKNLGINPSKPIYPDWITSEKYNDKLKEVFEENYYYKNLPYKIGLMNSAIILSIICDELVNDLNLKELKGIIELRNSSHLTHGFKVLNEEDFKKIRRISRKLLEKYLSLKGKPMVKEFEEVFSFPKL